MTSIILVALLQVSAVGAEQNTFEQAYQQSVTTGRPLVVLIGAVWCPGCQTMKNSILPRVAEAGGLDQVVFYYVDFDRQRQLATQLKHASAIPQLIRFDRTANGWKTKYIVGAKSPREVYDFINAGLVRRTEVSEVSTKTRSEEATREPAVNATTKASRNASRSFTVATTSDRQSRDKKVRTKVPRRIEGPSEWIPFFSTTATRNRDQENDSVSQGNQTNTRRR